MNELLQHLWNGISAGSTYALLAVSISLVFGLSRIINFAVGQFLMFGAFAGFTAVEVTGNYLVALVVSILVVAILGVLSDRLAFQFTYDSPLSGFIVSLGITLLIQAVIIELWSAETRFSSSPIGGHVEVLGVSIRWQSALNTVLALGTILLLYGALRRFRFGRALRAVADDRRAAALMGIPVKLVIMGTFVLASAVIGLNGWLALTSGSLNSELGRTYMLRGFAVALVGGLGSIEGAVLAGLGLGVLENLAVGYADPAWSDVYIFGIVILLLLWRPSGLGRGVQGADL